MKRLTKYVAAAAAVLLASAGTASAQTLMKAEVPFAFSVGNKVVEPGTYQVRVVAGMSSNQMLGVFNIELGHGYLLMPRFSVDAPKQWIASGLPRMSFDCSTGACILTRIWFGEGSAYELQRPKTKSGETHLTEIVMTPDRGN